MEGFDSPQPLMVAYFICLAVLVVLAFVLETHTHKTLVRQRDDARAVADKAVAESTTLREKMKVLVESEVAEFKAVANRETLSIVDGARAEAARSIERYESLKREFDAALARTTNDLKVETQRLQAELASFKLEDVKDLRRLLHRKTTLVEILEKEVHLLRYGLKSPTQPGPTTLDSDPASLRPTR